MKTVAGAICIVTVLVTFYLLGIGIVSVFIVASLVGGGALVASFRRSGGSSTSGPVTFINSSGNHVTIVDSFNTHIRRE